MENYLLNKYQFTMYGKQIDIYPSSRPDCPVVYLNTFSDEGGGIYKILREMGCKYFTLVAISSLEWNNDMPPWDIPPVLKDDTPFTGGADKYLKILTGKIIPETEKHIQGSISWRAITGYSLAGLFAVYSIYHTDIFTRAASVSGSFWFPGFKEYVFSHKIMIHPGCIYLSLGNTESKTKNPYLKTVQENTEAIFEFYKNKGIDTIFQLNQGSHFKDIARRMATGIKWILEK